MKENNEPLSWEDIVSIEQMANELWDIVLDHQYSDPPIQKKFERYLVEVLEQPLKAADYQITQPSGDPYEADCVVTQLRSIYEEQGRIIHR